MPFTFEKVSSIGDILDTVRHTTYFPALPSGISGDTLTLRHGEVTLPEFRVAQVKAHPFGWPIAFAGRREMENTFTMGMVDTTNAPATHALASWQDMCSGFHHGGGQPKSVYAINAKTAIYDTTGEEALIVKLYNVWPMGFSIPPLGEESAHYHYEIQWSIDAMDIVDIVPTEPSYTSLSVGNGFVGSGNQGSNRGGAGGGSGGGGGGGAFGSIGGSILGGGLPSIFRSAFGGSAAAQLSTISDNIRVASNITSRLGLSNSSFGSSLSGLQRALRNV